MSYDGLAIANFMVERELKKRGRRPRLTNMHLQKILYFAQGHYLARTSRRLFTDPIEAWEYGPVVPEVYHAFKASGANPIKKPASSLVTDGGEWRWSTPMVPARAEADRSFLDEIFDKYAPRSAVDLMRRSHESGGPWSEVYVSGGRHIPIPPELMLRYFKTHPAA